MPQACSTATCDCPEGSGPPVDLGGAGIYNGEMKPRGFTLVELLVAISIIAMLLGLLVSSLRASRERARGAVCASNVRQLMIGLHAYESANGTFPFGVEMPDILSPFAGNYAGCAGSVDLAGWWWFDRSQEVNHLTMDGLKVLTCPSKRQDDPLLAVDILCGNYGANLSICRIKQYMKPYKDGFYGSPLSLDQIRRPSETLLLVDSGYSLISWWHAAAQPPVALPSDVLRVGGIQHTAYAPGMSINRDKILWPGQSTDAVGGRHPGRTVNVGLVDGSVAVKQADDLMVEKTSDEWWNYSPLWESRYNSVTSQPTAP